MTLTTNKKFSSSVASSLLLASSLAVAILLPSNLLTAQAYDLGGGRRVFGRSPILTRSAATLSTTSTPATYQFTIEVPEDVDEPLKAVTITPKHGAKKINFNVSKSEAFIGDSFAGGTDLALADIGGAQMNNSNEVTIVFDEPVQPGNTVTVSLKARNPNRPGVYLFGVTAFPEGENSPGLYLGSGRLHIFHN